MARKRYFNRISGPLLDRVDIQLSIGRLSLAQLSAQGSAESSASVSARVREARERASVRLVRFGLGFNAEISGQLLRGPLRLPESTTRVVDHALERGMLTARGYDRVLRLAWTLADLASETQPGPEQLGQALSMRQHGFQR